MNGKRDICVGGSVGENSELKKAKGHKSSYLQYLSREVAFERTLEGCARFQQKL